MFPKMTAETAKENVKAMMAETKKNARQYVWREAIKSERLTDEAKAVYRQALEADTQ